LFFQATPNTLTTGVLLPFCFLGKELRHDQTSGVPRGSAKITPDNRFGFLIAPFCCAHLYAQGVDQMGTGGRHRIQGRIYFPSGRRSDTTNIKVTLESTSSERIFVIADMNGSFTFNNLAEGNYTITVDAGAEYEQAKESVLIEGASAAPRNQRR
jgi:hypothetical protein